MAGFVPLISAMTGFVAYYWVDLGYGAMLSVSVFERLANATEANRTAANWIKTNLNSLLAQDPEPRRAKRWRIRLVARSA